MDFLKKAVAGFFDFLQGIVVVLAILVMVYLFVMSPQEISGRSMETTFLNGEYILTNKIVYKLHNPERGDIVIFKSPKNKDIDYIKRVIALPGETVTLKNNAIYVNDQKVEEPYLTPGIYIFGESYLQENQSITVSPGLYFVLGDNRPQSSDSREFGPIAKEEFIGKAILRYWPFSRFWIINKPVYAIN